MAPLPSAGPGFFQAVRSEAALALYESRMEYFRDEVSDLRKGVQCACLAGLRVRRGTGSFCRCGAHGKGAPPPADVGAGDGAARDKAAAL